jgi:hypothetical protein
VSNGNRGDVRASRTSICPVRMIDDVRGKSVSLELSVAPAYSCASHSMRVPFRRISCA